MEEAWFRKEGFHSNPFSIKPAAFHNEVVGYKLEPIIQKVEEGNVLFVEAPLGSGKTTILKKIIRRFKGSNRIVYYSQKPSERIEVERLLKGASVFGKFLGKLPRDVILLVDEASDAMPGDYDEVLKYTEQGNLKSVVFFGTAYSKSKFPEGLQKLLNGNVVKLSSLTPEQAVELVRKRIGRLELISDDLIQQAFVRVHYNPRRLLEACEDICREAASEGAAKQEHVEKVLGREKPKPTGKKRKKSAGRKRRKKEPEVVVHEVKVDSQDNFNLDNIRTYEQEMGLAKQEKDSTKL